MKGISLSAAILTRLAFCLATLFAAPSAIACSTSPVASSAVTVGDIARRVENLGITYIFIGEHHGLGAPKRFAVDLVNRLVDRGHDVGLYVEGFRTDCEPTDRTCRTLAGLFNAEAFSHLLRESRAPVRPLDPPERDRRAARMAATIAEGVESVRVILAGSVHVAYANDPEAELWIFGRGMRYPDPGDLVEAFPRADSLTVAIGTTEEAIDSYVLRLGDREADYILAVSASSGYGGEPNPGVASAAQTGIVKGVLGEAEGQ